MSLKQDEVDADMDLAECSDRDPTTERVLRIGPGDKRKLYVLLDANVSARLRRAELVGLAVFVQLTYLLLKGGDSIPQSLAGLL